MTARKCIFYTDPGHGWLAVKIADLRALGIRLPTAEENAADEAAIATYRATPGNVPYPRGTGGHDGVLSGYSYARGGTAYLEEDCDAGVFLDAAQAAGWVVDHESDQRYSDHTPIRSYGALTREMLATS